jgi:hypothetical protein
MKIIADYLALILLVASAAGGVAEKPKLTLKANPMMAFSPARIVVTGELTGGANDNQDFYCAGVQWEWDDGTFSEEIADCEPYHAGKSEIQRHFTTDHTYRVEEGNPKVRVPTEGYHEFHIQLRLKKSGRVITSASTTVRIKGETNASARSRISPEGWLTTRSALLMHDQK